MTLSLNDFMDKFYMDKNLGKDSFSLSDSEWEEVFEIVDRELYEKLSIQGLSSSLVFFEEFSGWFTVNKSDLQVKINKQAVTRIQKESFMNIVGKEYRKKGWNVDISGSCLDISVPMTKRLLHSIKMFFRRDNFDKN